MTWKMRQLAPKEKNPQLWHLWMGQSDGRYNTACGLRYGLAGSTSKMRIPAKACAKCLSHVRRTLGPLWEI